jgi:mRNA-degrading endonuclease RelE of RelBE toxin-antitoxin system
VARRDGDGSGSGSYRIVSAIDDDRLLVLVLRVAHRREVIDR